MIDAFVTEMRYMNPGEDEPYRVEPILTVIRQPWYAAAADWATRQDWLRRVPVLRRSRIPLIAWWYDRTRDTTDLIPLDEEQATSLETFLPSMRTSRPTYVTRGHR